MNDKEFEEEYKQTCQQCGLFRENCECDVGEFP